MASIDKRPNGKYRARWREFPTGPQRTRHFDRKADAQQFLDGVRGDIVRGQYIDPASGRLAFRDYAESWRKSQMHRASTAAQCETYLRLHAYPAFGDRPLASIRRSEIQSWVKDRSGVLASGSVELVYRWVSTIFKAAVGDRLIAASPCIGIKLPKRVHGEMVPLDVTAVTALAAAVPVRYHALIVFAAGTGLRQAECFGLTLDRVDFLRRAVRVDRQLIAIKNGEAVFGPPKTDASFRTVPLPKNVVDILAIHVRQFPLPAGLVFANDRAEPIRRSSFGDAWRRAADVAGLPPGSTFHDLRHFYASLLIAHGCSVKTVQRRLGHRSAIETLDTYSHLWPDSDDQTRDAIDLALGPFTTALTQGGGR